MADLLDEQQLKEYEALVAAEIRAQNELVGITIGSWRPSSEGAYDARQLQLAQSPQEVVEEFSRDLEEFNLQCNEATHGLQDDDISVHGILAPPRWYSEMRLPTRHVTHSRSILSSIVCLRKYVMNLDGHGHLQGGSRKTHYQAIRDEVHKLEQYEVNEYLLKKSRILDSHNGLSSIFCNRNDYPWDIRADARQLYKKWAAKDFCCDIYKGMRTRSPQRNGSNKRSQNLEKSLDDRNKADFHGEGKFANGQWWPSQSCAHHDGVHGHLIGGIYGGNGQGAFSVVLSGTSYPDKDNGSSIWYYGTAGPKEFCKGTTGATDYLITSMRTPAALKKPVRVLRSHSLPKTNLYRPARGIRYDGLYEVMDNEYVDEERQVYCFLLERCSGQDPIRYKGVEARPTPYEIEAYDLSH